MTWSSDVEIASVALNYVSDRYDIDDLEEDTPEAEQVNLVFAREREKLLSEHPWKFAKTWFSPPALSGATVPAEWTYMFTYFPDAAKVWEIVNPLGRDLPPIPFDRGTVLIGGQYTSVLLTNEATPNFMYSRLVTNPVLFTLAFGDALARRIAATVCMPLTGDRGLANDLQDAARAYSERAKAEDANEGVEPEHTRDPDWIRERN